MNNKLIIAGYQWCDEQGYTHPVASMTVEQLQQALCQTIDVLEDLDAKAYDIALVIQKWRGL